MDARCKVAIVLGRSRTRTARATRSTRWCSCRWTRPGVTVVRNMQVFGYTTSTATPTAARGRARAGLEPHRRGGRGLRDRPGAARPGAHPPLHARDRDGRARAGADGRPRAHREAFGGPLADQGLVRDWIAESRMQIDQARLLVLETAHLIDTVGAKRRAGEVRRSRSSPRARRATSSTARSRSTAARASPRTSRWRASTRGRARCGSSTGRTRCTCGRWRRRSSRGGGRGRSAARTSTALGGEVGMPRASSLERRIVGLAEIPARRDGAFGRSPLPTQPPLTFA